MADRIHIGFFTPGYPYVNAAIRAAQLSRRPGAVLHCSIAEPYAPGRDRFARMLRESDATHALLLEGDLVPPEDVLDRLLLVRAPVATALYPQWSQGRLTTNVQSGTESSWLDKAPARVFSVRRCLLGCVLVHREVFDKVPEPWFLATMTAGGLIGDDQWFCDAVLRAGFGIRCDGSLMCTAIRQGADLLAITGGSIHAS